MTSQPALIAFAILYGFFSGGFISLVSPLIVSISDHLGEIGCVVAFGPPLRSTFLTIFLAVRSLRQGIAFLCMAASALGGNPIVGRLLGNHHGDFLYPIVFSGAFVRLLFILPQPTLIVTQRRCSSVVPPLRPWDRSYR